MVINTDKITTVLGIVGGASAIAYQYNIAPQYTGSVAAVSGALLGFFTNKQPTKNEQIKAQNPKA